MVKIKNVILKAAKPLNTSQYPSNKGTSPKNRAISYLSKSTQLRDLKYES